MQYVSKIKSNEQPELQKFCFKFFILLVSNKRLVNIHAIAEGLFKFEEILLYIIFAMLF